MCSHLSLHRVVPSFIAVLMTLAGCRPAAPESGSSPATLPNNGFVIGETSSLFSENVAKAFPKETFNLPVDRSRLSLRWTLDDPRPTLLTRFGTPQLALSLPGEQAQFKYGIMHEAVDVMRSSTALSTAVHSPVSGLAKVVYDGEPNGSDSDPYSTAVCIRDDASQAVVCLLHTELPKDLPQTARSEGFAVKVGDVLGHMAPVTSMSGAKNQEYYKHSHVIVIDITGGQMLNPARYLIGYMDQVPPKVFGANLLDEKAQLLKALRSGNLDLTLEVADQDDNHEWNFEISKVSFVVEGDGGQTLLNVRDCDLEQFTAPFPERMVISAILLDLGTAINESVAGPWKDGRSDATVRKRTFRYALSHLIPKPEGGCSLAASDASAAIAIPDTINRLTVKGSVSDWNANSTDFSFVFVR